MAFLKTFKQVFVQSVKDFFKDNALKLSASLSYYTVFSIAPILIIIIGLAGIFFGREAVQGEVYRQFSGLIGSGAAEMVQNSINAIQVTGKSWIATIVGIATLLVGATGVFSELQDSLNQIWSLKAKPKLGIVSYFSSRLVSFSMVLTLGFLLMVSLLIDTLLNLLSERFLSANEKWTWITMSLNIVMIIAIVTILFACMFKFLPDAKIKWRHVWAGSLFTTGLFLLGKFAIGFYLSKSSITTTFGAAGSLAVLMAWVYYSSAIFFFGAEFTKNYSIHKGYRIEPNKYATFVAKEEMELPKGTDVCEVPRD